MNEQAQAIGHRIRRLRLAKKLSEEALAVKMQLAGHSTIIQSTQSKIELGQRDVTLREAISYARILDSTLTHIAYGEDTEAPD